MSQPLRLLTLATEYPPARGYGLGRYVSELSAALVKAGAEVHVVGMNYAGGEPVLQAEGVTVHQLTDVDNPRHYDWVSGAILDNLWLLERALEVVRAHGPFDMLMAHDWLGALAAKSLKTMYELPLVLFMHDTEPGKRANKLTAEQLYIAELETWACSHADAIVANSRFLAGELERFHKVAKEKVKVIPCGVNPKRFETDCHLPDFRALFAKPDEKLVLYLGRLSPMKGADLLVEAVPEILKQGLKARFIIAGEGVLREKLEARARELGVVGQILFAGHLAGKVLGAAYRAADLVVLPSRYEPFGMVALEAMSCGTPVAAADTGGLKEVVSSDGLCRRFAENDPKALASSVTAALKRDITKEDRKKLRDRAAGYSWDKTAGAVLGLCRELLVARQEVGA